MARPHEHQLRKDLVRIAHLCHTQGLLVALDGNLSVRLNESFVLCTRAGCHKGLLTDDDLIVVDYSGSRVRGKGEPTSELAMHLECYRSRPDVEAIVHAHPPTCIAFTVAGVSLARCILPEAVLTLGAIPTLQYATTGTKELAQLVGGAMQTHDAVLMDRHGAVCAGKTLLDAFCKLETMEQVAKVMLAARTLGRVQDLPADEALHLRQLGVARYGGPPASALPPACTGCSGCGNPTSAGLGAAAGFSLARVRAS